MFEVIHKRDNTFMILNGLLLMGITLTPFVTQLVALYILLPDARVAAAAYSLVFLWNAVMFNIMWSHASRGDRLFTAASDRRMIAHISATYRYGPLVYGATVVVSLFAPLASVMVCFVLAAYFALPPKDHERTAPGARKR
jgi:uncharacterized membrane protein